MFFGSLKFLIWAFLNKPDVLGVDISFDSQKIKFESFEFSKIRFKISFVSLSVFFVLEKRFSINIVFVSEKRAKPRMFCAKSVIVAFPPSRTIGELYCFFNSWKKF